MENKNELISIVVPVYNVEKYIEETIQTVCNQTYQNWELLLVNDCSPDATKDRILPYLTKDIRIKLIDQPNNQGAAAARNRGIEEASGRYLAFLDADDLWEPEKLEREFTFLKKMEASFVCTSYEFADEMGIGHGKIAHVPERLRYQDALKNTIIFTSTVLLDLQVLGKELITMPLIPSEDTATWWNILRAGNVAYGLDQVLVRYRRPANSLSSNKWKAIQRIWNLYRKQEKLSVFVSAYYFCFYAVRTILRRL